MVAEANDVKEVNSKNLAEFYDFAETAEYGASNPYTKISADLSLEKFFSHEYAKPGLKQSRVWYATLLKTLKASPERISEFLCLSEKRPDIVAFVYNTAGHSSNLNFSRFYDALGETAEKLSFSQNLALQDSVLPHRNGYSIDNGFRKSDEKIDKLSRNDLIHLQSLMKMAENHTISHYPAEECLRDLFSSTILLNCKNLPPEARKRVNEEALRTDNWKQLRPEFIDAQMLKSLVGSVSKSKPQEFDMRTNEQKEGDAVYDKIKEALLQELKKMPVHDSDHKEKEKTLNQRFKEFCRDTLGKSYATLNSIPLDSHFLREMYVLTAQIDIDPSLHKDAYPQKKDKNQKVIPEKSHVADLDKAALEAVIAHDRNSDFLKKIPPEVLVEKDIDTRGIDMLKYRKNLERGIEVRYNTDIVDANLSIKDKKELWSAAEKQVQDKFPHLDKLLEQEEQYKAAKAKSVNAYNELQAQLRIKNNIEKVQGFYADIVKNLKNGVPDAYEAMLTPENLEKAITKIINGEKTPIPYPEKRSLPLLFGRKKEETRRQNVNKAITEMNAILLGNRSEVENWTPYAGKVLSKEVVEEVIKSYEQASTQARKELNDAVNPERELSDFREQDKYLKDVRTKLDKREQDLTNLAKKRVGMSTESDLENPDLARNNDEKHDIRVRNKDRSEDKLATKAEKLKGLSTADKIKMVKTDIKSSVR